jgi:hypothetical protein
MHLFPPGRLAVFDRDRAYASCFTHGERPEQRA